MLTLFPFQIEGAEWLAQKKLALLADEMGLGKTVQAIVASDKIRAERILVICPAIARINWHREILKFSEELREWECLLHNKEVWDPTKSIITSYEGATAVGDAGHFDLLILDEAHFLKSKQAQRTRAILGKNGIARKCDRIWALTGTPAPNHPAELWPLLFTFGATPLSYTKFVERFCRSATTGFGLQIFGANERMIPELRHLMKPYILRRRKVHVMKELPPIFYSHQIVEPGEVVLEDQHSFLQYCFPHDRRNELDERLKRETDLVQTIFSSTAKPSETLTALEAVAKSVSTLRRYTGLQKVEPVAKIVADELEQKAYEKVVIFAIHRDVIEGLRSRLKAFSPESLYGGYDPRKKQRNIDRFQKNHKCRVMLCNIQCAGTAVTLTAANQIIFVEQDWVPGNNAQAAMRCHRIGQDRSVYVRFFGIANSMDERVSRSLKRKTQELTKLFDSN
jgi:SWI/SNF-related matrix-associated actin-dependent regulator 1 of chromatin subfamily A